jgi:cysteine desulfurase
MLKLPVYLDYNATTPVDPEVFEEMKPYFLEKYGNSSSRHTYGFEAESAAKLARKRLAEMLNAAPEEILFTSGATESINIIHIGIAKAYASKGKHIITSNIEHPAVTESLKFLEANGFQVTYLPVDHEGLINPVQVKDSIKADTILVSIMSANNEIGTISDLESIGRICSEANVLFHTDASQAMGKIPLDMERMKIDLLSFSGHKFYALKGTGGMFIRNKSPKIKLSPLLFGGGQEKGIRPGTLNIPGAAGLGKAAEICTKVLDEETARIKSLRDKLWEGIKSDGGNVSLNGSAVHRLPNNLNICIEGVKASNLFSETRDLAFSTGSACSSESEKPSPVLKAIGLSDDAVFSSIRLGIGRFTTEEEIDYSISRITEAVNKIRNSKK